MTYEQELRAVGVTIVRELKGREAHTLFLRVSDGAAWQTLMRDYMLGSSGNNAWSLDVSKYFFLDKGTMKYLWRIMIKGGVQDGLELLANCAAPKKVAVELDSFPLSEGLGTSSTQPKAK